MSAWFYILRLRSGKLYPGATTDIQRRYEEHIRGVACRTTRSDPPVALVCSEEFAAFAGARKREAQVKKWSRQERSPCGQRLSEVEEAVGLSRSQKRAEIQVNCGGGRRFIRSLLERRGS